MYLHSRTDPNPDRDPFVDVDLLPLGRGFGRPQLVGILCVSIGNQQHGRSPRDGLSCCESGSGRVDGSAVVCPGIEGCYSAVMSKSERLFVFIFYYYFFYVTIATTKAKQTI